jgi:glycosyltransferase involved in cell wall biosynthesis
VVIRAKNEARFIGDTLQALFEPDALRPCQVIVVDSGSTDGTQAIVRSFPAQLIQIAPEDFTYGYALNLGVANVDAELVDAPNGRSRGIAKAARSAPAFFKREWRVEAIPLAGTRLRRTRWWRRGHRMGAHHAGARLRYCLRAHGRRVPLAR